ncbi:MAG: hypothetical protein N2442_14515 [Spirochaetes bacterium]|nr:hypothetical protein [Spirochaetota bacterium]
MDGETNVRISRLFDWAGWIGFVLVVPVVLDSFGIEKPLQAVKTSLGEFGEGGFLLLLFLILQLLSALFGTAEQAFPILAGLSVGVLCLGTAFDIPYLSLVRKWTFRFPFLQNPTPSLLVGVTSLVAGTILGRVRWGYSWKKAVGLFIVSFLLLVGLSAFPQVWGGRTYQISIEAALKRVYQTLGKEYKDPRVEEAVRRILEEKNRTVKEKEQALEELQIRLKKAEEDRTTLSRQSEEAIRLQKQMESRLKELEDTIKKATENQKANEEASREIERLKKELETTRKALTEAQIALEEARKRIQREEPLVPGRDYEKAVQPRDPVVRDFAVQLAKEHPGAFDEPQGSRFPTEVGFKQLYRIHQFVSSQWKYVSDPNVNWFDYASPARRTIAVGLAGDCDDFAILLASLFAAIGARVRIMHGYTTPSGHAWTEVWIGRGAAGQQNLNRLKTVLGSSMKSIEYHSGTDGSIWLITDWSFGKLSIRPHRLEVAWQSD